MSGDVEVELVFDSERRGPRYRVASFKVEPHILKVFDAIAAYAGVGRSTAIRAFIHFIVNIAEHDLDRAAFLLRTITKLGGARYDSGGGREELSELLSAGDMRRRHSRDRVNDS